MLELLLFAVAVASTTTNVTPSQAACHSLEQGPLKSIVFSSGRQYATGVASAWNLLNAQLSPACIVFPQCTQDVSVAMSTIYEYKANYSVQAGGHSAMQGWNNVQGGVLIHFMNMKNISYDAKTSAVTFEPGLNWGEALDFLEPYGVAVAGGRVSDVGTGLLLGGGISYLAGSHGYSVDTMREADVVLVTGKVVTATPTNEYADLFRALKGGANRFGIVTRYVVDGIHTGTKNDKTWYGGQIFYDNSSADAVLLAVAHYAKKVNDPKTAVLLFHFNNFTNGEIQPVIVLNAFYNGSSLPEELFGEFLAIPTVASNISALSYYDAANLIEGSEGSLVELFGASVLAGSETDIQPYRDVFALYAQLCIDFKDELGTTTLAWSSVLQNQIDIGRARGGNAIDAPYGGFMAIQFSLSLPPGANHTSPGLEAARQNFFQTAPRTPGLPFYINESDKNQTVFATYGGYEFLKQTYQKYDPERFNVQHTNGPMGL